MKRSLQLVVVFFLGWGLTGCNQVKTTPSSFEVTGERGMTGQKQHIPRSGNVVLFFKEAEASTKFKRLDFSY